MTWLDEHGVAARLHELKEDATTWLGRTSTGQFSLAGAQAKTALLRSGERWGVPSGPYLVLPLFGPSSFRDSVGFAGLGALVGLITKSRRVAVGGIIAGGLGAPALELVLGD